ncbi:hypothetical protein MMC22_006218 [Lobaria immixta]|nr:hypothetical protein [Lobaria immixta]
MANEKGKCHLLSCASEIRNAIYSYVLTYDNPIIRGKPGEATSIFLALLQVSKSVEREAAAVFYERNLFRFNFRHLHISFEHDSHVYNEVRAKEGLSSYDDAQMKCPIIDVPQRHIGSLRELGLIRRLLAKRLGPQGLGILDLEKAISFLAARNANLKSLTITLKRTDLCDSIQWDPDPSTLLRGLDADRRISTAVGKLENLGRLEFRVTLRWPRSLQVPSEWKTVQPGALDQVQVHHFAKAKAVRHTRRAEVAKGQRFQTVFCIAEQVLIDFQQTGVND